MEASGCHLKGCGELFFSVEDVGGTGMCKKKNTGQKNVSSRHKAIKPVHPPEVLFKELITLC